MPYSKEEKRKFNIKFFMMILRLRGTYRYDKENNRLLIKLDKKI